MDVEESPDRSAWAIPPQALHEWLTLAAVVDQIGPVPCETTDAEAWWPAVREIADRASPIGDIAPARMALDACSVCGARQACLDYALAADERYGIWGGLTPRERRKIRLSSAA